MFQGVSMLIGIGARMEIEEARRFLEANAAKIRETKPLVRIIARTAGGSEEAFRPLRLSSYIPDSGVIAIGAPGDPYQGLRHVDKVTHLQFI